MILAAAQGATPSEGPDPDLVTPGTIGFLATLLIVIIVVFLIRDALRRVRRVRARSQADDAYPIPLRKHAVPNQSKLSGESAQSGEKTSTTSETDASGAQPAESDASGSVPDDSEQTGRARSQD
ncbi:hypothetical protein [Brevibacterium marinum]|uniref:Uncharacterized protein n=1 Tax=Brevibacterium marinum TaxID=418643 RepID=A0A846S2Y1_9MICO|nr:hypothetical protein [Brevibacterium marinum]NJC57910.1 hypothetical protein [Brevibacterium marinum]